MSTGFSLVKGVSVISRLKKQFEPSRAGLTRCAALIAVALVISATNAQATLISGLFPTGVDGSGNALAGGVTDPHYTLLSSDDSSFPTPVAAVVTSTKTNPFPPGWAVNTPNTATSAWISANPLESGAGSGLAPGTYIYRLTFTLDQNQNPALASITGHWTGDSISMIYLNGTYVPNMTNLTGLGGQPALLPFNIPSGGGQNLFVAGVNHLDFVVVNASRENASGLMVNDITGNAPLIPEPSTVVLSLIGGVGLVFAAWRRRRLA